MKRIVGVAYRHADRLESRPVFLSSFEQVTKYTTVCHKVPKCESKTFFHYCHVLLV